MGLSIDLTEILTTLRLAIKQDMAELLAAQAPAPIPPTGGTTQPQATTDHVRIVISSSNHTEIPLAELALFAGTQLLGHVTPDARGGSQSGTQYDYDVPAGSAGTISIVKDPNFNGAWINSVSVNSWPYQTTGNFDGTLKTTQGPIYNSKNANMVWVPSPAPTGGTQTPTETPAPPVPPNQLAPLFATPAPTVSLPAGVITGSTHVNFGCTISGQGMDVTIVDGTGTEPSGDKALFHTNTPDVVTFNDFTIKNAKNPESMGITNANAAAIKPELQTMSIVCNRMKFVGNQNGLLCAGLEATDCVFDDNGCGQPTKTHEIYVRGTLPLRLVRVTTLSSTDANHGHAVKSRSPDNYLEDVNSTASLNGDGHDFPDCGFIHIKGGSMKLKPGAASRKLLSVGNESATNANAPNGKLLILEDWEVSDGKIHFGAFGADYQVQIINCKGSPTFEGLNSTSQITGAFTPA